RATVPNKPRFGQQCQCSRYLECCRGTQSRPDRHLTLDDQLCAANGVSRRLQHCRDSAHIVAPMAGWTTREIAEIELPALVKVNGIDTQLAVSALPGSDVGIERECRRHDEAIVVVGMLTNEIHRSE